MLKKVAIRIVSSEPWSMNPKFIETHLFAVCSWDKASHFRAMAKKSLPSGSSDWVTVQKWT